MRLVSKSSETVARKTVRNHGGWQAVRESGRVRADGVLVVCKKPSKECNDRLSKDVRGTQKS